VNYSSRIFLNKKTGMAAMQVNFDVTATYVDSSIVLSDCGRQVNIDLDSHTAKGFGERQLKLHVIIHELMKLEDQMAIYRDSPDFKKAYK
jgi:hypothetical protein